MTLKQSKFAAAVTLIEVRVAMVVPAIAILG
jgi:Tfp pilus assembly protein PilV